MALLRVEQLGKVFNGEYLWKDISFSIEIGEKVGLLGPNGCGKSTLIKALLGDIEYDDGEIIFAKDKVIATVSQKLESEQETENLQSYLLEMFMDILKAEKAMHKYQLLMEKSTDDPEMLKEAIERYTRATDRYERLGGYLMEARIKEVVIGLGFGEEELKRPMSQFSGGQKTRISLARSLLREPDILILDEPNNYLDLQALAWLEQFLSNYKGAVLVVSHDRYFLDAVIDRVLEFEQGKIYSYVGNYSSFVEKKEQIVENHNKLYAKQQEKIAQTEAYIQKYKAGIKSKQARGRQSQLDRLERLEKRGENQHMKMHLEQGVVSGKKVLILKKVSVGYGDKTIVDNVSFELMRGERVGIIGPNGCGKTTMLKAVVGELPFGGKIQYGVNVEVGWFSQEHELIQDELSVLDTLMEEGARDYQEAREILAQYGFIGEEVYKKCERLSGGEKSRLVMAVLMYKKPNLLVLDEPTNHLDIYARQALEDALEEYQGTILFVSHDRYFLKRMAQRLLVFENGKLDIIPDGYAQYLSLQQQRLEAKENETAVKPKKVGDKKQERVRKARIGEIERLIDSLEQGLDEIHQSLLLEEVYSDPSKCREVNEELEKREEELNQLMQEWEELMA
ncbi:ABC-F family ATP-binding cassette domain-containing protein [Clostridia bacterium]|nr:ABC-F family ATP-binding cassette domain-containing protein [Clostridia bacterium]